jgi:hypothetical protein
MTAPRPPERPQDARTPVDTPRVGSGGSEPAADATALRDRIAKVLHSKVTSPHPLADGHVEREAAYVHARRVWCPTPPVKEPR